MVTSKISQGVLCSIRFLKGRRGNCFIRREVIREEHDICVIHSYFSEGNYTKFLKGYPNKTLHPFLKSPEERVFLGFEGKKWPGTATRRPRTKKLLQRFLHLLLNHSNLWLCSAARGQFFNQHKHS